MPREVAFTCHKCGRKYNGGRCPKCYKRKRGGGGGRSGGRRGARLRIGRVLASDQLVGHSITDSPVEETSTGEETEDSVANAA